MQVTSSPCVTPIFSSFTVLYYSNDILRKSLPEFGPYVSLGITIVNVLMTFPTVFLIEVFLFSFSSCPSSLFLPQRTGRKKLLQLSVGGALLSLVGVGVGLDGAYVTVSSVAILTFVMCVILTEENPSLCRDNHTCSFDFS